MGLVAFIAGASALVIKAYMWLKSSRQADVVLESISRQAAVVGTFANVVFAIIDALTLLKVATSRVPSASSTSTGFAARTINLPGSGAALLGGV